MKSLLSDLAILGGPPEFEAKLHVGQINLPPWERFVEAFEGIFERQFYTNHGPLVRELDRRLAEYLGVEHAICMTNGTVALMVAAKALGLTGEVILPSFTFVATAQAMSWAGLTPVFCDVDPVSHTITSELVEPLITERTSAILGVHLWGRACDIKGLEELAGRHGLNLMFDAAHAMGCSSGGRMIGGFGDVEIFSMHATKICNALEGGAATTNDPELAARIRTVRNFHISETQATVSLRLNGKMSEAQAAMGLLSLDGIDGYIAGNKERYEAYQAGLHGIPGLSLVPFDQKERNNYQYVVAQVDGHAAGLSRDAFVRILQAENVLARRYFKPGVHRTAPYRTLYPQYLTGLPVTERLSEELMQLPSGQAVNSDDVKRVCDLVRFVQANWVCRAQGSFAYQNDMAPAFTRRFGV